jgi:hypothetical protein
MHTLVLAFLLQISVLHPLKLFVGYTKSFNPALLLMACCLFGSGMHTFGIVANPQDIAPSHAGSVFGIMNAGGAIPGTFIFVLFSYRRHLIIHSRCSADDRGNVCQELS